VRRVRDRVTAAKPGEWVGARAGTKDGFPSDAVGSTGTTADPRRLIDRLSDQTPDGVLGQTAVDIVRPLLPR